VLNLYAAELAVERATEADIGRVRAAAEATAHGTTLDQVTASITGFLWRSPRRRISRCSTRCAVSWWRWWCGSR